MSWLPPVIRVAIAPVLVEALALLVESRGSASDLAAAVGLLLLSAIHVFYWWRPWPSPQRGAVAAVAAMVLINFVLLNLLRLPQPIVWLYPALIAGAGLRAPLTAIGVGGELAAAAAALRTAGIELSVANNATSIDPAHETTIALALREAVTNMLKHSGASICRITLDATDGSLVLDVQDDGRGPRSGGTGTGLAALRDRIRSLGGTLEIGPIDGRGFRLRMRLGAAVLPRQRELAR